MRAALFSLCFGLSTMLLAIASVEYERQMIAQIVIMVV